jgi:hypothetical protein
MDLLLEVVAQLRPRRMDLLHDSGETVLVEGEALLLEVLSMAPRVDASTPCQVGLRTS